jgi:arsenate reductase
MKVLILCTGNSCRSQMAHGFLQSFDKNITVCSAGTQASGKLNAGAVKAMAEVGIDISHHTSDPVEKYLGEEWDYVITVCGGANENCPMFVGKVSHRLHIGFDDLHMLPVHPNLLRRISQVRDEIKKGFQEFYITQIRKQELPSCSCGELVNALCDGKETRHWLF